MTSLFASGALCRLSSPSVGLFGFPLFDFLAFSSNLWDRVFNQVSLLINLTHLLSFSIIPSFAVKEH